MTTFNDFSKPRRDPFFVFIAFLSRRRPFRWYIFFRVIFMTDYDVQKPILTKPCLISLRDPDMPKLAFQIYSVLSATTFAVTVGNPSFPLNFPCPAAGQLWHFHLQQSMLPKIPGNSCLYSCSSICLPSVTVSSHMYFSKVMYNTSAEPFEHLHRCTLRYYKSFI